MGKKAKDGRAAKQRSTEEPPLDDDLCWLPIEVAHRRLVERIGNYGLATRDLNQALAQGRLPCMVRSLSTGERRWLESTAWVGDHPARIQVNDGPPELSELKVLADRLHPGTGPLAFGLVYRPYPGDTIFRMTWPGWVFYVSKSAYEALWPSAVSATADSDGGEPLQPIDRAKAVLLHLYPTKEQMPRMLKAATNAVENECKRRGWQPVKSQDTVHRAAEELGYRPPRKRR